MEKTLIIEGMMCPHCEKHMTKALKSLNGVTAKEVSHEKKCAVISSERDVPYEELDKAVTDAGYKLIRID